MQWWMVRMFWGRRNRRQLVYFRVLQADGHESIRNAAVCTLFTSRSQQHLRKLHGILGMIRKVAAGLSCHIRCPAHESHFRSLLQPVTKANCMSCTNRQWNVFGINTPQPPINGSCCNRSFLMYPHPAISYFPQLNEQYKRSFLPKTAC